jgi:glutathione S-transferase
MPGEPEEVPQSVAECFKLIERELFVGPWLMGDTYTICDLPLYGSMAGK